MFNSTLRYCSHMRCLNSVTGTINTCFTDFSTAFVSSRNYSQGKGDCCKDIVQTQGKRVEPWPKPDPPPPAWRLECPNEPQPPNYDPYRIKVPDVVCPPLPPSNAKWTAVVWTTSPHSPGDHGERPLQATQQQQNYGPFGPQPNYPHQNPQETTEESTEESPPSFFGFLRGLFGRKGKSGKGEGEELQTRNAREVLQTSTANLGSNINSMLDLFRNAPVIHPDYFREPEKRLPSRSNDVKEPLPRLGYHGKNKYKYAFHEPWKPLDRLTLLSQAEKEELGHMEVADSEKY